MADKDVIDTLIAEAIGEGPEGMRRVAETILNRAAARGLSPAEVVRQSKQYTGYSKPGSAAKRAQGSAEARAAAQAAWDLAVQPGDPTGGADHYFNPSVVQPRWASGMTPKGEFGGHAFYSSRPIPPGELQQVASLQDTKPPIPMPVTSSPNLAALRSSPPPLPSARPKTAPSNLISQTMASLSAGRGSSLGDSLALSPISGGRQSAPPFDAAYDTRTGQMRMLAQPETVSSQGLGVGTSAAPAPRPALPSPQLAGLRATDPALQAALNSRYPAQLPKLPASAPVRSEVIATYPTGPSPIGKPPATRVVPSVPVRPSIPQSYAGQDRYIPKTSTAMDVPQPAGSTAVKDQSRLAPSQWATASVVPGGGPAGMLAGVPAVPATRSTQVATQLSTTPPLPIPRPGAAPAALPVTPIAPIKPVGPALAAPTPMPRLDRPGIFGAPKVFGRDVPMPGILGLIQGATKAMANASGPFNNGADNLLYNTMRGGDFNTPGAATHVGTNGYLYAPKAGGGFVNVGRANPAMSNAELYESRRPRNPQNAADRMRSNSSRFDSDNGDSISS